MRGFAERSDVADVERSLREASLPLVGEAVAVVSAAGRVLRKAVTATLNVPGYRRSAMDGYAVHGADTFGASDSEPLRLTVVGESLPGRRYESSVQPGQAVRIMTGAPMPEGADAVVPVETTRASGDHVEVLEAVAPLKHVGAVGEDIREGQVVLEAGRRLRAQDCGLLASIGLGEVQCVRRPRVDLFSTGNELLPVGRVPTGDRIVDSNSVVLRALVERDGATVGTVGLLPDRREEIRKAMAAAEGEVLLISGGSSVGQEDHAPGVLAELGSLDFHGVTMRPSSPAGGGRIGDRFVFLLPGNPVSCLCAYEFFAGPLIRRLGGGSAAWPHRRLRAPLARKIVSQIGRTDYVRVELNGDRVVPIATSGAAILSSTVRAAGAVIVPRQSEGFAAGAEVEVLLYDQVEVLLDDQEPAVGR